MPLRLRVTGTGLRITGTPREPGANPPLPPAGALLATENNDLLVTEAGEHILVEPSDGQ